MDLNHYFGGDLAVSPSGDLALASVSLTGTQRIYRRLLTNPKLVDGNRKVVASGDYIAHQDYGAGVGRMVGSPQAIQSTAALIKGQILLESAVAKAPAPVINLTPILNGLSASIKYTDANTAAEQFVSFDITE